MKKISILLTTMLFLSLGVTAQAPDGVNYQAVVRNSLGLPLNTQIVNVRFTIHQGSPTGTAVFQEVHATSTNQFGLINLNLGSVNNGAFSLINWGTGGAYYLQIEVDAGSGYDNLGASQLLSVPYALFAKSAATGAQGFNSLIDTVSATAAVCPTGGYQVLMGLDTNANTILDPAEITSSFLVCNGTSGAAFTSDTSATNEIQTLSISNDSIFLTSGGFVVLPTLAGDNWGTDVVNTSGANISGDGTSGNPLIVTEGDPSVTNEIQVISISNDTIFLSNGGFAVLPTSTGDNWGTDIVNSSGANISGDGTSGNPLVVTESDPSSTNEIQNLTIAGNFISVTGGTGDSLSSNAPTIGDMLYWNGSSWIAQPVSSININDPDSDPTNEFNTSLIVTATNLEISDIGGTLTVPISSFDPGNEYNTNFAVTATDLEITDANGIFGVPLTSLDPGNEYNTNFAVTATDLEITDANGIFGVPLSLLDPGNEYNTGFAVTATDLEITDANGIFGVPLTLLDPGNEYNTGFAVTATDLEITDANGIFGVPLSVLDPGNEFITGFAVTATDLQITDGGGIYQVPLTSLDPGNEFNTAFWINGPNLELTDGNGTFSIPLASIGGIDADWTVTGNDMLSTVSGDVGIGVTTNFNPGNYQIAATTSSTKTLTISSDPDGIVGNALSSLVLEGSATTVGYETGIIDFVNTTTAGSRYNYARIAASSENANPTFAALRFYTRFGAGLNEQMIINENGDIGIGTSSPLERLHIMGDIMVDDGTDYLAIRQFGFSSMIESSNLLEISANGGGIVFDIDDGDANFYVNTHIDFGLQIFDGTQGLGNVLTSDALGNASWQPLPLPPPGPWTGNPGIIYPSNLTDMVGIGTSSPNMALNIQGTNAATVMNAFGGSPETSIRLQNNDLTNNNFSSITFSTIMSNAATSEMGKIAVQNVNHTIGSQQGDMAFFTRNSANLFERMRIDGNGNVGIGTTAPSQLLDVDNGGSIEVDGEYTYEAPKLHYLNVSNKAFTLAQRTNNQQMNELGNNYRYIQTGTAGIDGYMYATVQLPDDAVITHFEAWVIDSDAANDVTITLSEFDPSGPVAIVISSIASVGSVGLQTVSSVPLSSVVDNSTKAYHVEFRTKQNTNLLAIVSFKITYTVLKAD